MINSLIEALKKSGRIVNIHSTRVQDSRSGLIYIIRHEHCELLSKKDIMISSANHAGRYLSLIGCSKSTLNIVPKTGRAKSSSRTSTPLNKVNKKRCAARKGGTAVDYTAPPGQRHSVYFLF